MKKKIIVFGAVYLVVAEGIILLLLALQKQVFTEQFVVFVTGSLVLLIAVVVMKIIKRLIHKHRPPKRIEFFTPFDRYAFPSGHATGLASVSFFILERDTMLGLVAIFVSLVIMIARVKAHVHDSVDIIAGIILGAGIAYLTTPSVELFVSTFIVSHMSSLF